MTVPLLLGSCGRNQPAEVDSTAVDRGQMRQPAVPQPAQTSLALPNGTTIHAPADIAPLAAYLSSGDGPGRSFELTSIGFVNRADVRQDPNGSLTALSAILDAHPSAKVQVQVIEPNREAEGPRERALDRARAVAQAIVQNGVPADRVSARGIQGPELAEPEVRLLVVSK